MSNSLNGARPVFVKTVSALTSIATVLTLSGAAYLAPLAASAAVPSDYGLTEGNMISAAGSNDPDIYIVNAWGYKRLFLNPAIFNMYGQLTGGWSLVKNVSVAARDAFPTTQLFRNCETNNQAVYAVEVTGEDTATLHHVVMSGDAAVAQDANFFKKVFCVNSREQNWYTMGADYTSLSQIPPYVRNPGATPTPSYGALSVSLASDNPAASTLISGSATTDGQARADLAHFMFTGSGTVTSMSLNRLGISADTVLNNVYLYDGAKRLTDAATVSNGVVSFNDAGGLFTVNGSRIISVKADILYNNSGQTVGVQLARWNGNAVSISGNLFTLATATLATVALSSSVTPSSDGSPAPQTDFVAWQDAVTVGSRYVWLNSIQYRVVGSVQSGDVQNFRLFVDGIQQGSAVAAPDANGYIVFDMSASPVRLETGSRTVKVLADIINGSGRNFYLSLRQKSDIWVVDSQYAGASILATGTFPVSSTAQTIAAGTVTVVKTTDSPSGDIVKGASGVALARYKVTAYGEKMKFESIRVSNTSVPQLALRNGALFADDGMGGPLTQIGSTQTIWNDLSPAASSSAAYTEYSLGSSFIVDPLRPRILEIRADIYDASGTDNTATGKTIVANIVAGSSNVQRLTELDYPTTPYTAQTGNTLTIRTGTLTAAKYSGYANQSVVAPVNNFKLGAYTLSAASSEDVNINTLTFDGVPAIAASLTNDFSNAYVVVKNDAGSVVLTTTTKSTFSTTASNSYSVNFLLPKNKTYQIELWGTANSSFRALSTSAPDVFTSNFDASGVTTGSSTTSTATQVTGQTITSANGSLTVANGAIPPARLINGGQTASTYSFTLTPTYDNYTLQEVYVDIASATTASNSGAVSMAYLKNASGTVLASAPLSGTGSASFTGLNLSLPQSSGTQTFTVDVAFSNVGVGSNDTAGSVTMQLDGLKYLNGGGTPTTTQGLTPASYTGNAFYDVKGYPTFTNASLPSTVLSPGTFQTVFKTVLSANGGQISWNQIVFTVASNSAAGTFGPAASGWKLYENGTDITTFSGSNTASVSDVGSTTRVEFTFATERAVAVGSPVTLELKTTSGGTIATNDYLTTQITNPTTTTVTTLSSTVQGKKNASFVWSDQSAPSHATTTDDWFTDGMVTGLVQSETVTK